MATSAEGILQCGRSLAAGKMAGSRGFGSTFSYDGYTVPVPNPWPLKSATDSQDCPDFLRELILANLGPNPTVKRIEGGTGVYLTQPGQAGLSSVGKETLMRILCQVKKLAELDPDAYEWVSQTTRSCVARFNRA